MTTTDLYACIQTQAFPPSDAVAKWVLHYRINANFLLAQIGKPFLTEAEYRESGPLDSLRNLRGDFVELDDRRDDLEDEELENLRQENTDLENENAELTVELRGALKEIRQLNEEKRELEERLKASLVFLENEENPEPATSDRPATGAPEGGTLRNFSKN